jgi:hypothetical protein
MQILYAALAAAAWLFISGAIVFAVILPKWFQVHFGHIARGAGDNSRLWAIAIEKILQGFGLALIIKWSQTSILHLTVIPLLLMASTYLFSTYTTFRVAAKPVLSIAVIDAVRLIAALFIAGLILGRALV